MNNIIKLSRRTLFFGVSISLIGLLILIAKSPLFTITPNVLSLTITIDLLISIPVIHYFLIRKTEIPKTSISSIIVLGLIVGMFIIPIDNQNYLNFFRIWLLPIVEISIIVFIIYEVRKALRAKDELLGIQLDFFSAIKKTCYKVVPKILAMPIATEVSVIYYGLFYWKKRSLKANEFSYYKKNTTISTLIGIILILSIETIALHAMLMDLNNFMAWIITFGSFYTILQVLALINSITKRPICLTGNFLVIRYGILRETNIFLDQIESFKVSSKEIEFNKKTRRISPLGDSDGHNIIIKLNKTNHYSGFYGLKRKFDTIAFYVDNVQDFSKKLENALQHRD